MIYINYKIWITEFIRSFSVLETITIMLHIVDVLVNLMWCLAHSLSLASSHSALQVCVIQANKSEKCSGTISITLFTDQRRKNFHSDRALHLLFRIWGTFCTCLLLTSGDPPWPFIWFLLPHTQKKAWKGCVRNGNISDIFTISGHWNSSQASKVCYYVILCHL